MATIMTVLVVAVAMALPACAYLSVVNLGGLTRGWSGAYSVSAFLGSELGENDVRRFAAELRLHPDIGRVEIITPKQAMAEYANWSGFGDLTGLLDGENPLPPVLLIEPRPGEVDLMRLEALLKSLEARQEIELATSDAGWLLRLGAILALCERVLVVVLVLIAFGVTVLVGNTVRVTVENRREEIEICKLFGASDGFVRRPFLYQGLVFGLLGGATALLAVELIVLTLSGPVHALGRAYDTVIDIHGLDVGLAAGLLLGGGLLGLAGSWLAVGRHLRAVEPD
ncbi:MAG: permease-like cell division protein FtsX [Gammaproteobacteria bacterium]|nr:permease-like cell division protein FtsX [Gammaproteobacteria bacterium]